MSGLDPPTVCRPLQALAKSDLTFHCPMCTIQKQSREISTLKESLSSLQKKFETQGRTLPTTWYLLVEKNCTYYQSTTLSTSPPPSLNRTERKCNLIFAGIPELPTGTKLNDRLASDFSSVSSIVPASSIM